MTQILKGRFDGSKARHRACPASPEPLTDRHTIDENGRRVLVGLTSAETREFETLDSLSPSDGDACSPGLSTGSDDKPGKTLAATLYQARRGLENLEDRNGRKPVAVG